MVFRRTENSETAGYSDTRSTPRAQRSEALLRELYHEEVNPRFRAPRMRGIKLLFIASILSISVFAGTSLFKYNNFIALREAVYASKGNLQGAIQRRTNLFSNMVKLTLSHAQLEHAVYSYAARMRTQMSNGQVQGGGGKGKDADALLAAGTAAAILNEKGLPLTAEQLSTDASQGGALAALAGAATTESSLSRLMAVAERYPEIRSSETYHKMMDSLMNMEDLIANRRMEWHHNTRDYNSAITGWPWTVLARVTGFDRMDYFETLDGYEVAPVFTSEIYGDLMPVAKVSEKRGEP